MSERRPRLPDERTRLLLWALIVGALGGSAALLLRYAATRLPQLVWGGGDDLVQAVAGTSPAWRLAVPAAGALLAGLVLTLGERWSGASRGWDILEAVVLRNGVLPPRPTLVKSASSLLTQASAGAVGREGPIVLLSATVSSVVGQRLGVSTRHLRILVGCGIAAGLACAYNTPLGAALFTMEILFGSFALEVFAPLVLASVVSTLLSRAAFGDVPVFGASSLTLATPWEVIPHAALGLLGGLTAVAFLETLRGASSLYRRTRLPRPLAMATAGLFLGVVILRYPEIVGNGREAVADLFRHQWGLGHVAVLLGLRLIATPLMVGSGAVGGVFTPTLFLGAMLGHGAGLLVQAVAPGLGAQPGTYALVGMGALLAGTTHAPMTSVLMVFEMTLDYNVVVPLLLAAVASSLVATRLSRDSVYTEALRRKAESPDGEGAVIDVLTVRDVMREEQVTVAPDLPLPLLLDRFVAARRNHLYVVDAEGRFRGAVNLHDVNRELRSAGPSADLRASDLLHARFEATTPEERLDRVLERFAVQECERLPVLADPGSRQLVGTVSKRDILAVYSLELLQRGGGPRSPAAPVDRLVDELEVPDDLVGVSLDESRFRDRHGLSVLMIRRGGGWILPEGPTRFQTGDRLIVFGPRERLADYRRTRAGGEARG